MTVRISKISGDPYLGQAACEGLALTAWYQDRETINTNRITDLIVESYN